MNALLRAVLPRPRLWPIALSEAVRFAPTGWWRRWPPVPRPDPALWRFRIETAYGGSGDAEVREEDVVTYLEWCRGTGRLARPWRH